VLGTHPDEGDDPYGNDQIPNAGEKVPDAVKEMEFAHRHGAKKESGCVDALEKTECLRMVEDQCRWDARGLTCFREGDDVHAQQAGVGFQRCVSSLYFNFSLW
jgi:hypothetical protein